MGFIGNIFNRRGHRVMTTIFAICFGVACLGMSFVNSLILLFAGFMAIRMLGQGSMSFSGNTLVPQWFITKKGKALSYASFGGVLGYALLPPLNTWLIQNFGWRFGWIFWAILLWAVMAPLAYIFIRNRPEEVGLWPDNKKPVNKQTDIGEINWDPEIEWTLREAIRTKPFWLLLFASMVPGAIVTGLTFHSVSLMAQMGLSAMVAALVLTAMAVVRFPFVLIVGSVSDNMQPRYLIAIAEVILFIALVVLLYANSIYIAIIYGALIGILIAIISISRSFIWPEYFGRQHLSSIRGVTLIAGVIGSALGPLPFGMAYDHFGGYQQIIVLSMIFPLLGIGASLLARPPQKSKQRIES